MMCYIASLTWSNVNASGSQQSFPNFIASIKLPITTLHFFICDSWYGIFDKLLFREKTSFKIALVGEIIGILAQLSTAYWTSKIS